MAAVLLPNGKQSFFDLNGDPLVGGKVYFYVPETLVPKDTWQDSEQLVLNTNPVVLDERGEAVIYGVGTYRQILKDANGNTIWDQPTVGSAGSGGAASEPYEIVVQNLDGSDLCDLSVIPELFSVAFITPDDPSDPNIQSFGAGRMGQQVLCQPTANLCAVCDGVQIKGNRNARASGRSGFPMDANDSFLAICLGGNSWMFVPWFSEINRRTWPAGAGSGAAPSQAYLTLSELYPNNNAAGPQPVLQNFLMGGAYVLGDLNTHKFQAGGLRLMNADDSAALFMLVCARDPDTNALKQPTDYSNQSDWCGLLMLVDDTTNWNSGVAFVPNAANLPGDAGVPGSLFQGVGARWFFMPTASPSAGSAYGSTPAGWSVHTSAVDTQMPQAAYFTHDNGNTIFYGAGRYEFAVASGELDPYPYHVTDLYTSGEIAANFSVTQICGKPDTRWMNHRPHAAMEGNAVDITTGGVSNYCGAVSVVNHFDKNEAWVWGRTGHTRASPNGGYYGEWFRKVSSRGTQTLIRKVNPTSLAQNWPAQPAGMAYVNADVSNVTGNGTVYTLVFNAERADQGSNFNTTTGKFTAPVTGLYRFNAQIQLSGVTASCSRISTALIVETRFALSKDLGDLAPDNQTHVAASISGLLDLIAGDVVSVTIMAEGEGSDVIDVLTGVPGSVFQTYVDWTLVA